MWSGEYEQLSSVRANGGQKEWGVSILGQGQKRKDILCSSSMRKLCGILTKTALENRGYLNIFF